MGAENPVRQGAGTYGDGMQMRAAAEGDRAFIVEMARLASSLEGRHPVPDADAPVVLAVLPGDDDVAVVAVDGDGSPVGAAWSHAHKPALLVDDDGRTVPEVILAVVPPARGRGIGAALLDAVADATRPSRSALSLNVHLLNPAVRLYIRKGFRVAGAGRGWYGVAMRRELDR